MMNKLIVGTANFAQEYNGVKAREIDAIFDYCREVGIDTIDTAVAYGSEYLIPQDFKVISKLPNIQMKTVKRIKGVFYGSLRRLKQQRIYGYLLHIAGDYQTLAWSILKELKKQGLINKIGVSIYQPWEIQNVDIIQCEYQRYKQYFPLLKEMDVEIHVRKVMAENCLIEAVKNENVDKVIIGINCLEHLKQNVQRIREAR